MNTVIELHPSGVYTASQAIAATGIKRMTFYRWLNAGKIPSHYRMIDGRRVFKGSELIKVLTECIPNVAPVFSRPARRGRPRKEAK